MMKRSAGVVVVLLTFASAADAQRAVAGVKPTPQVQDLLSPGEKGIYEKSQALADSLELDEAEALLRDWKARNPKSARACGWVAEFLLRDFFGRPARFDEGMEVAERCIALDDPKNTKSRQTLANKYLEKAHEKANDPSLTHEQSERYADQGLKYVNLALEINRGLIDSIMIKGILLQVKAQVAKNDTQLRAYLEEATLLIGQAKELKESGKDQYSGADLPVLAPPSSTGSNVFGPLPPAIDVNGPRRVGGEIKEPIKLKDVPPAYPELAFVARVQGVVILECTISAQGTVVDVKILRSVPLLDQAAIDAVKQWVYTPTLVYDVPVPVIITVTVTFSLK